MGRKNTNAPVISLTEKATIIFTEHQVQLRQSFVIEMKHFAAQWPGKLLRRLALLALLVLLPACGLAPAGGGPPQIATGASSPTWTPVPLPPTGTPPPPPPSPTPLPPDSGWEPLHPGLERRLLRFFDSAGELREELYVIRVDPDQYRFEVAYRPGEPLSLPEWQEATGALLVVNGGFFTEAFEATGLVVVSGVPSGVSYGDFAGMLAVGPAGPDLRWLAEQAYDPAEPLSFALQSFPLLVKPGGVLGYPDEDGDRARRTVIARDRQGRFLFLVAPYGMFTLHELSTYLANSDLELDIALNLDGGTSSGIGLAEPLEARLPYTRLPTVIALYPRP